MGINGAAAAGPTTGVRRAGPTAACTGFVAVDRPDWPEGRPKFCVIPAAATQERLMVLGQPTG